MSRQDGSGADVETVNSVETVANALKARVALVLEGTWQESRQGRVGASRVLG